MKLIMKSLFFYSAFVVFMILSDKTIAQNFNGGNGDGFSITNIAGADFNLVPEVFTVILNNAVSQPDPTNLLPIYFTVDFNRPPIDFTFNDINWSGTASGINGIITGGGTSYTIEVNSVSTEGTLVASIPINQVHDAGGKGNQPSLSTYNSITYDITKPDVTINQAVVQADPSNITPINFTATFSEIITGFDPLDISLGGTTPGLLNAVITGSGPIYNIAVSGMTGDGTVTATINSGGCADLSGNTNTASTSTDNSVTFQFSGLTVSVNQAIGQIDPTNQLPIVYSVEFNRNVVDFTFDDIIWSGTASGISGNISGSGSSYSVNITGIGSEGTLIATIPANQVHDVLAQGNLASTSTDNAVVYDITKPDVTINQAILQSDPTTGTPINFTITFSEVVAGFDIGDISLGGTATGTIIGVISGTGPVFNLAVSGMTGDGTVTANVIAGACADLSGNTNTASTSTDNSVQFQTSGLTVSINQDINQPDPTNQLPIVFSVEFNRNVVDFTFDDIIWSGTASGISGNISGSGSSYSVNITAVASDGSIIASIPANQVHDVLAQGNQTSTSIDNSINYDITRPGIEILAEPGQNNPTNNSIISFRANFTEQVQGFVPSYVSISGTAGANTINLRGGPLNYTIDVSGMTNAGTVIVSIAQNLMTDAVGNLNVQSINTYNTVVYDNIKPDVTVGSSSTSPTSEIQIPIDIVFSKLVTDFEISDINISNGTIGSLTEIETGIHWEGVIIPISVGIINVQVPADAASDVIGNYNNASNHFQIEYVNNEDVDFVANNVFTPNGTQNRFWTIKNVELYQDYELVIRNGSGQIVYQTKKYQNDWNGTYKNKPLPTGTYYFYLANSSKNSVHKGFINIIYE